MEGDLRDGCSVTASLSQGRRDEEQQKLEVGESEGSESNYDRPTKATTFLKTCFNGVNSLSGVGILSVPYALSSGGWLSFVLIFAIAAVTFYTGLLIKRCMDVDPGIRSYPDIGGLTFGKKGRLVVTIFMNLELYFASVGFLILEGDNLYSLFPIEGFEICGFRIEGKQVFVIIVGLIILPTVLLEDISVLSYVSAVGALASVVILVSVFWAGAFDGIRFQEKGELLNWNGVPTAISLYAFCYEAHPIFPTLYTSMRNRKQFSNVLLICFVSCTITYASMAVIGYLMFGTRVESQITLNLPTQKMSSKVAIYTALLNPITKYALIVTPIVNLIENGLPHIRAVRVLVRTGLLMSTVIVALAIPFFGYLMSLVGAFLSITVSILLPCLCYLKISGSYERLGTEVVVIGGILVMGLLIMAIGTYTSLAQIIAHL